LIYCQEKKKKIPFLKRSPFFGEKLHRRAEEVMKEPPFVTVEVIEERDNLRII